MITISVMPSAATEAVQTATTKADGIYGENLSWELDIYGTLVINGKGKMPEWPLTHYYYSTEVLWYKYRTEIKKVVISEGLTSIGIYSFSECSSLRIIELPKSLTSIGASAFDKCSNLTSIKSPKEVKSIQTSAFRNCKSLTIHCYKNSYAHLFAKENKQLVILKD